MYVIKSGSASIDYTTYSGSIYLVGLLEKFTVPLGTSIAITGENFHKINLCVLVDMEIVEIPTGYFNKLLDDSFFFKKITNLYFKLHKEVLKSYVLRVHKPLYYSLALLFLKLDKLGELNMYNIAELSRISCCSRVNFYRSIETLKEMGVIVYKNKKISIIDYNKIEKLLTLAIE
ncbi:hypothetical protein NRK67_17345 (plasmid) [Fusobacteria bacterium ZRK30]|nr:hypothetical protein NRK67_17345 [Fusobacteria bacterium ZRK30]